ncbi:MAG: hypothetical protein ABIG34_05470 [Candidatus Peregrinibacteria bacterium]
METSPSTSSAQQLLSVRIRSGRDVREVTTNVQNVTAEVRTLCAELAVDEMALERICASVQQAVARVGSLGPDKTIVFCDCDAQFTGNCRLPFFVGDENPCNADSADKPLKRVSFIGGHSFPVGALQGSDATRTHGTPLKLCGQRVEISAAKSVSAATTIPAVAIFGVPAVDTWATH